MLEHDLQYVPPSCIDNTVNPLQVTASTCSNVFSVRRYAVILAFDIKVEREAQEMADSLGVQIFSADIIYHLFDSFTKYREEYKKAKQEEFK